MRDANIRPMLVNCPECGARLDGSPGDEMVCPACMTPFVVPAAARAVRAFDVQLADGTVLHALGRHALREGIYAGRVDASARVRHEGGRWELIGGYPEFAAIFRLLGADLAPLAGARKLAGWKGASPDKVEMTEPPRFTTDLPAFMQRSAAPPTVAPAAAPPAPRVPDPTASPLSDPTFAFPPPAAPTGTGTAGAPAARSAFGDAGRVATPAPVPAASAPHANALHANAPGNAPAPRAPAGRPAADRAEGPSSAGGVPLWALGAAVVAAVAGLAFWLL